MDFLCQLAGKILWASATEQEKIKTKTENNIKPFVT